MLRKTMIVCAAAMFLGSLAIGATASAETLGTCNLTGHTFMGGGSAYTSTPEDNNGKDYFLGQPLNVAYGDSNFYGYGWTKFDVGTTAVDSAYLVFDLLGVGAMSIADPTPENPAYLDLYDAGTMDVADLGNSVANRDAMQQALDASSPLASMTMTSNGTHYVDITDLYNAWATGTADNNGLVFSAPDDSDGAGKYVGFGNSSGNAPYISSTAAVPEPSTLLLLVMGVGVAALWRKRMKTS